MGLGYHVYWFVAHLVTFFWLCLHFAIAASGIFQLTSSVLGVYLYLKYRYLVRPKTQWLIYASNVYIGIALKWLFCFLLKGLTGTLLELTQCNGAGSFCWLKAQQSFFDFCIHRLVYATTEFATFCSEWRYSVSESRLQGIFSGFIWSHTLLNQTSSWMSYGVGDIKYSLEATSAQRFGLSILITNPCSHPMIEETHQTQWATKIHWLSLAYIMT